MARRPGLLLGFAGVGVVSGVVLMIQEERRIAAGKAIKNCSGSWELVEQDGGRFWRCISPAAPDGFTLVAYVPPTDQTRRVAQVALTHWELPVALIMVAIAGAESRWNPAAAGDRWWGRWSCRGYQSWGLWQIRIPVWKNLLMDLGAPRTACGMAQWLTDPDHNARAANAILGLHGPDAWSSYQSNRYAAFAPAALSALLEEARARRMV